MGDAGYKHQQGEKGIAITDHHGYVGAPVPVAPVNETDRVLFAEGLKALKQVAKQGGLDRRGAYLNRDGGFDSRVNRQCIFHAGLMPNIPQNPRNRQRPKRGRKRRFNATIHALRMRVERTLAWEDKCKRLLRRFERLQQRHYGMKLLGYTMINLRAFCGI
jgi:Transposase DDE domain